MPFVITSPDAASPEWLTEVLYQSGCLPTGRVVRVRVTCEESYTSTIVRLELGYADVERPEEDPLSTAPRRLFLKLSRSDSKQRVVGSRQRRHEVEFHTKVVALMPRPPVVRCYDAVYCPDTGASHLLFDDHSQSHYAVESWVPPSLRRAGKAVDAFAKHHAFWWDHRALGDVAELPSHTSVTEHVANTRQHFGPFADALGDRLSESQRQLYERTLASLPSLWGRVLQGKHLTLIHGDASFSNVLLPRDPDGDRAMIIDWQLWGASFAAEDLTHLIALFWDREHRQKMEKNLLVRYHQALIRHGVEGYGWTDCWTDYRLAVLLRVLFMPMWFRLGGSPRAWWERSLNNALHAVEDLDCRELLES